MFLNKINESESISLTNCIDTINYYINDYLEKFFPNDSIIVDIVPFKEKGKNDKSDKNDVKPGIDIKICYKGEEVELSSLSGGEYDRVSLAIMLAFNNICKSSMILLDESISSLDSDLTNDILEKLKENLSDKRIIMVAHQISTGLFDQVVNTSK
jgi:energy-coupling factor transporter ATP-binding protein EcfA2